MRNFISGKIVSQRNLYKSFQPEKINKEWMIDNMEVVSLLSKADRNLGRLDMYSEYVNLDLYISMHIVKEATQSSRIEGTQTNIEEVFFKEEEIALEKRNDWHEVQNYIEAMNVAVNLLEKLPFSSRLIREIHKTLLQGVRGEHKLPGEFRTSQNWIGGASINDAVFVPPTFDTVHELMSDLENFANNHLNNVPDLIKIAIIHYQFETIHPFLDGNGKVGRLLITLYLVNKGILKRPILYLSDFFEKNRMLYYDNLMRVRTHNNLEQWLKFFLTGVIETAKKGIETFDSILKLQKDLDEKLNNEKSKMDDIRKIISELYYNPVLDVSRVMKITEKKQFSGYKILKKMEELHIIKEISGSQRNRLYVFEDYLSLFRN